MAVATVRLALWLLPSRVVLRQARRWADAASTGRTDGVVCMRAPWAVSVTARYIPLATCLTRALATQLLLARAGHRSSLEFGVTKDERGRLQAHAWVLCDGNVVIGGEIEGYSRFPELRA